MGKVSMTDKMRMQTLHEHGLGAKAIITAYPDKQWKLSTVKKICRRVDKMGSALERRKAEICPHSNKYRSCRRTYLLTGRQHR